MPSRDIQYTVETHKERKGEFYQRMCKVSGKAIEKR